MTLQEIERHKKLFQQANLAKYHSMHPLSSLTESPLPGMSYSYQSRVTLELLLLGIWFRVKHKRLIVVAPTGDGFSARVDFLDDFKDLPGGVRSYNHRHIHSGKGEDEDEFETYEEAYLAASEYILRYIISSAPFKEYEGLEIELARIRAGKEGKENRVVMRDGRPSVVTRDYHPERLNFTVEKGIITKCEGG